jgi:hypothetical protein
MRGQVDGRLAVTPFLVALLVCIAVACSGGTSTASPTPSSSPVPSLTPRPTTLPTTSPTPTEYSQYGAAPAFADLSNSIDAAIASNGGPLPPIAGGIDFFNGELKACDQQGLGGVAPQLYATAVVDGCETVAQALSAMYQTNPTPEIEKAFYDLRRFTIGAGGEVEQLGKAGKPASSQQYLDQNFFRLTPTPTS